MDFDNRKVYGDTSITDGLVEIVTDVNTEDHVGNSLLIWELEFVQYFAADVL